MSGPTYSAAEVRALRVVSSREWSQPYSPSGGPPTYARGPYWPKELRRKADEMERLAATYRVAADAMAREVCHDEPVPAEQNPPSESE